MPNHPGQKEWYWLRISVCVFVLSFKAWPRASEQPFRRFSGRSVFVSLSGRSAVSCVSTCCTLEKTSLGAGEASRSRW